MQGNNIFRTGDEPLATDYYCALGQFTNFFFRCVCYAAIVLSNNGYAEGNRSLFLRNVRPNLTRSLGRVKNDLRRLRKDLCWLKTVLNCIPDIEKMIIIIKWHFNFGLCCARKVNKGFTHIKYPTEPWENGKNCFSVTHRIVCPNEEILQASTRRQTFPLRVNGWGKVYVIGRLKHFVSLIFSEKNIIIATKYI